MLRFDRLVSVDIDDLRSGTSDSKYEFLKPALPSDALVNCTFLPY